MMVHGIDKPIVFQDDLQAEVPNVHQNDFAGVGFARWLNSRLSGPGRVNTDGSQANNSGGSGR